MGTTEPYQGGQAASTYAELSEHALISSVAGKKVFVVDSSGNQVDFKTTDAKFNTNHIDDYTTTNVVYICQEDASGTWRIKKIDSTGTFPVFTWASVLNNPSVTTYTAAYTARATTLVYGLYSTAF